MAAWRTRAAVGVVALAAVSSLIVTAPAEATKIDAKPKPKIIVVRPTVQRFRLKVVGSYTATDGFGTEAGTISIEKLPITITAFNGQSVASGQGNGRVTGTLESKDPICRTPANGYVVFTMLAVPMMASTPPSTVPAEGAPAADDELTNLGDKLPAIPANKIAFSLLGSPQLPGGRIEGPSAPCVTPVSTTITFVGAAAVAILARASSSKPFLFFDRSGGYIRKTVTDGPYSYDLEFTLTKA